MVMRGGREVFCGKKVDEFMDLVEGKKTKKERQEGRKIGRGSPYFGQSPFIIFLTAFTMLECGLLHSSIV